MKLRSIIENEYAGLEDNDEFEDAEEPEDDLLDPSGDCEYCDVGGSERSLVYCSNCGSEFCGWCGDFDSELCQDCGGHAVSRNRGEYDGLEDNDEFEDDDTLSYEDQIFSQATITRGLPRQQIGPVNTAHPNDHVAIVNLMHFRDDPVGNWDNLRSEWHFFEIGVTPWIDPEILASFDEAVERCRPFAADLIRTALEEYQATTEWMRPSNYNIRIGRPGDSRTPIENAQMEMERIKAGDLALALNKILV